MSSEQEDRKLNPAPEPQHEDAAAETLTDLIDRMDREAFRRALEQRDLRLLSAIVRVQR